jgi:tRNA(Ile)-lysidine synthase
VTVDILEKVITFCQKNSLLDPHDRLVIGVSGGPDSLCLLHILFTLTNKFNFPPPTAAHLNHHLRGPDSQADENFVKEVALHWQLPIVIAGENIADLAEQRGQSVEETARQVRYAFLWRVARQTGANKIAVGHHADDQVETVLMHFLRGAGLAGLRGMLPEVNIANLRLHPADIPSPAATDQEEPVKLIRPLLEVSRADIEAYCRVNNLLPRQDYSNLDTTFFRNRLRHELIPYLETYNPNIRQLLQHTAKVAAADVQVLKQELTRVWPAVIKSESPQQLEFDLENWLKLPLGLKRSTLRRAVELLRYGLRDISFSHIENAIEILEKSKTGAIATLPQGLRLTVSYDTFVIGPASGSVEAEDFQGPQLDQGEGLEVNVPGITPLPNSGWQLTASLLLPENIDPKEIRQAATRWEIYLDAATIRAELFLRSRQPGDRFYPLGMAGHSKKLNEFMIDKKIPAHWRDRIPLLVSNHQILWVCGYQPAEQTRVKSTTRGLLHLRFEQTSAT